MIQLDRLERRFGKTTLFSGLSWRILAQDRVGLVGPNGAGKTTVLRLLAGIDDPDEGAIHKGAAVQVAYLPQEVETIVNGSVLEVALSGMEEVGQLEARLQSLEHELATMPQGDPELDELTERYGELRHRFEDLDGDRAESRARAVLSGLGVPTARFHEPLEQLSGGWRMRVALARLLLGEPDLLLLDEPTNHLDLEALGWLEQFLADRSGAYVIVSHDRYFLNRLADGIVEIADGKLTQWTGNYDAYVEGRALRDEQLEKQAKAQERKRAETERFVERFRYKATKARQVQSRIKQLAKQDSVEQIAAQGTVRFGFPPAPRSGDVVASLKEVSKSFDEHLVYRSADLLVRRGDRLAVVGPNGSGKSTLLRMLSGRLHPDSGEVKLGHNVQFHYYAQHQLDELDGSLTVLEEMRRSAPEQAPGKLRSLLGCFLFQGEAVEKRVAVLSGGEKARLALAKMLVRPANLLLLDEPTNHLDLASREVLEDALNEFDGTIVLVSHDRYFMNRVVSGLVEADEATLRRHEGDYDSFYSRKQEAAEATVQEAQEQDGADSPGRRRELKRLEAEERNRNYRVEQQRQKRLQPIEDEIATIEKKIGSLTADQARPEVYSDPGRSKLVAQELKVAQERLGRAYEEWERLEQSL